jgi:anti-sigma factor RsiW
MSEPALRCIEVVELVGDYLDGHLDASIRRRVEEHLVLCPPCRVYIEQVRETVRALGELPAGALSDEAVAELEHAFRGFRA